MLLFFKLFELGFHVFDNKEAFVLESGASFSGYHLGYTTYGRLNEAADNVVWVFHALTANSDPAEWWSSLVGEGTLFNPQEYFIVCVNMPGSCYGSTGPLDINPESNKPFFHHFPFFTTRDMVRSYQPLRKYLGIKKIKVGIGGSMGGQQLLEWAIEEPDLFEHIFPIATNAVHSPWGKAFNASQRFAIETDPTWNTDTKTAGMKGMKVARSIALLSYRHYNGYSITQSDAGDEQLSDYRSESYQRYQGEKLGRRFNAFSYYVLSKSMDAHNIGRARGGAANALKKITARTTVIGIESDLLFPITEQQFLAEHIRGAQLRTVQSQYGHDGFLIEFHQLEKIVSDSLSLVSRGK